MLEEQFFTSIRAQQRKANTAVAKDVGIFLHTLHPTSTVKTSYKKSSTPVNALAASSTHIFAAQAEKAIVHIYSRATGIHEGLVSFPERIHSLALIGDAVLVLGTAEGRVLLWEVCTGRHVSTTAAHLQAVSCLAATQSHLASGSEDSNIHIWSLPSLLSLTSTEVLEPARTLSNHRAAITSLVMGHSATSSNLVLSASKDNTIIAWSYDTGTLLRTFLLPATPLCLTLDPCDRAVYAAFEDGTVQLIEFIQSNAARHPLHDESLQNTPTQVTLSPWTAPSDLGAAHCLGLSYDGTILLTGHATGKIVQWDTGRRAFAAEVGDLNNPVTNLLMLSPFPEPRRTKAVAVTKPKLAEGNYTFTAQLKGRIGHSHFDDVLQSIGFPDALLEDAIAQFSQAATTPSSGDEQLQQVTGELCKVANEQRALQKKTWNKYSQIRSGGGGVIE